MRRRLPSRYEEDLSRLPHPAARGFLLRQSPGGCWSPQPVVPSPERRPEAAARCAFNAKARYIAPVSRLSKPKCRARWRAIVLFPAPAGPSIAMMILPDCDAEPSVISSTVIRAFLSPDSVGP